MPSLYVELYQRDLCIAETVYIGLLLPKVSNPCWGLRMYSLETKVDLGHSPGLAKVQVTFPQLPFYLIVVFVSDWFSLQAT